MTTQIEVSDDFKVFSEDIHFSEESSDPEVLKARQVDLKNVTKRVIKGYASKENVDSDDERVMKDGLDITYFKSQGWFNWMHNNSPSHIIGCPTEATIDSKGLFVKGMLFKTEMANHVWNLICELQELGNPRNMGFSIEGKVTKRSEINKSKILAAKITNVAITHIPVNTAATLTIDDLSKSMVPTTYDDVLKYVMKDMGALGSTVGAVAGNTGIVKEGDTGSGVLKKQDLEGVTTTREVQDEHFRKKSIALFETRKELHDIIKSASPNASDVVVDEVINLIMKAGGLDNFLEVLEKSDIF